jgi:hypothetical protein
MTFAHFGEILDRTFGGTIHHHVFLAQYIHPATGAVSWSAQVQLGADVDVATFCERFCVPSEPRAHDGKLWLSACATVDGLQVFVTGPITSAELAA